jgi:hypothetical protein
MAFSGIMFMPSFMKIDQLVQKLKEHTDSIIIA